MTPKTMYLALCVVGTVLPYSQFVPCLRENGLDLQAIVDQLISTRIGAFFGWDVIVSSLVLWVFVAVDGRRKKISRLWLPILASLTVGVSLGLPLFLYMRERKPDASRRIRSS